MFDLSLRRGSIPLSGKSLLPRRPPSSAGSLVNRLNATIQRSGPSVFPFPPVSRSQLHLPLSIQPHHQPSLYSGLARTVQQTQQPQRQQRQYHTSSSLPSAPQTSSLISGLSGHHVQQQQQTYAYPHHHHIQQPCVDYYNSTAFLNLGIQGSSLVSLSGAESGLGASQLTTLPISGNHETSQSGPGFIPWGAQATSIAGKRVLGTTIENWTSLSKSGGRLYIHISVQLYSRTWSQLYRWFLSLYLCSMQKVDLE
ncbi:unnamed protein product [Protopolystoma xenopodis]|uniref:Uncharacterized protein n=1 Tax=Protopolystoma xenopodis TaxID=117903 RepID=A0A448XMS7_9PLAT|nr:unnamed protein product [Protopolystoma xenopodis]